jgi:hypothetical protein
MSGAPYLGPWATANYCRAGIKSLRGTYTFITILTNWEMLRATQKRYTHKTSRIQNVQDTESLGFTTSSFTYLNKNKVKFNFSKMHCTGTYRRQNRHSQYFKQECKLGNSDTLCQISKIKLNVLNPGPIVSNF